MRRGLTHTHEVLGSLELLLAAATDSETAERGYVITGDESYLDPYRQAAAVVEGETRHLRELTADNRAQQQRLDRWRRSWPSGSPIYAPSSSCGKPTASQRRKARSSPGRASSFTIASASLIAQDGGCRDEPCSRSASDGRTRSSSIAQSGHHRGWDSRLRHSSALALFAVRRDFAGRARAERALREANDQLELRVQPAHRTAREGRRDGCTAGRHHRVLRRCDRQQESGGHHHQLEPGRGTAVRLLRTGGRGQADGDADPAGAFGRGAPLILARHRAR